MPTLPNVFTGTTDASEGFSAREYHTAHMPDFPVPPEFKHTPPIDKPSPPSTVGFTAPQLAEVAAWMDGMATPADGTVITYVQDYEVYNAALASWNIANKTARLTQWRILIGDALVYNKPTTSRSADTTGAGSGDPPAAVFPRNDP